MKPWIVYSLARLGIFVVLLVILVFLFGGILPSPAAQIAATAVAAVIAFCISYLALGRLRSRVTTSIADSRGKAHVPSADEAAEDAAVEGDVDR